MTRAVTHRLRRRIDRQLEDERCARRRGSATTQGSAVLFDRTLREGEAESRAAILRREERLEDSFAVFGRYSRPRVAYGHAPG